MKKDLIFGPALILVAVALCLLKFTGMTAHIAISIVGLVLLVVYAVLTKKEWKIPALEIVMRVFYGIALISGIVIMNIHGIAAIAVVHKISAILFAIAFVVLFINKLITNKKV
jgi:hypothetical protein